MESSEQYVLRRQNVGIGKTTRDDDERWYKADHVDHVYPSVTSILRQTMSPSNRFVLWRWKREKRKELGDAGLKKLHQETLNRGVALHKTMESFFLTGSIDVSSSSVSPFWRSVEPVLDLLTRPLALESTTVHSHLHYAGTFDCIAMYRNRPCLIEWKTSDRARPTLAHCFDFPIQAAAYAGAVNVDANYPFKVDQALVVVAYGNGDPAHVHWMPLGVCEAFWDEWLRRLDDYRKANASASPVTQ